MLPRILLALAATLLALLVGGLILRALDTTDPAGGNWTPVVVEPPPPVEGQVPFVVYLLGGSTTEGVPYDDQLDLGQLMALAFDGHLAGRPLLIENLGRPGRSAGGARADLEAVLALHPDPAATLLVVYSGNNEFLRFDPSRSLVVPPRPRCDAPVVADEQRAAILDAYREHLTAIVEGCQAAGLPVIVAAPAVNQRDWEPNRSVLADAGHEAAVTALLEAADARRAAGDAAGEADALEQVLALEPRFAQACFRLARLREAAGEQAAARVLYQAAVDADGNGARVTSGQVRDVVLLAATHGVPLLDAAAVLADASATGVIGDELMWDNCHPTLDGYRRLAAVLADLVHAHVAPDDVPRALDLAEIEEHFGLDDRARALVAAGRAQYVAACSVLTADPGPRLGRARRYLERALTLRGDNGKVLACGAVLAAMDGDLELSLERWRRAAAIQPEFALQKARGELVAEVMLARGVDDLPGMLAAVPPATEPRRRQPRRGGGRRRGAAERKAA